MLGRVIAPLCLALFSLSVQGAEGGPAKPVSVYQVKPVVDGTILTVTALGNLVPYAFASKLIHPRCPCDPGEVNAFDRQVIGNANVALDNLSDATAGVALLGPPLLDALDVGFNHTLVEDLVVYSETVSLAGAFATVAKYTVQRPLPRVYAGQAPELINKPGGYRSFYSGHTTLTFSALSAASVTNNLRHHSGVVPWLITAALGSSVAYERIAAGRHFPTDVIVGALTGVGVGTRAAAALARPGCVSAARLHGV